MSFSIGVRPLGLRAASGAQRRAAVALPRCPALVLAQQRRGVVQMMRASEEKTVPLTKTVDEDAENLTGDFCSIDATGKKAAKRTQGEMEQEFLEACQAWYFDKKALLTDEEFENLREELLWSGSKVAILDADEQKFLEASMAYARGKPLMSDEEYDALKNTLKSSSSIVTAQGPRCSIRTRKLYSDASIDVLRMTALNIPAVLLVLGFIFAIDDVTGFEITQAIELPPPWGLALLWGVILPSVYVVASALTNIGFKDNYILKGPCPNCGTENFTYFGDLLTVPGNRGTNVVDCVSCNAGLTFDQNKKVIVIDETPEEREKKMAALAAKKAASAKKKAASS